MDIKYMEYILTLANTGNISQAAKELYISQPTLSQFIRNYQGNIGIHLFERKNGRYVLTPAGETFCNYARQILDLEKDMNQAMQCYKGTQVLNIGTSTSLAIAMVTHLISPLRKEFPSITITMSEGNSHATMTRVLNNDLDMAFGTVPDPEMYKGRILLLKPEKIALAVPSRMPLCRNANYNYLGSISAEEFKEHLRNAQFILQHPGSCIRHVADDFFHTVPMNPNITLNTSNASTIVRSVASGTGIGFIPVSNMILDPNINYFLLEPQLYRYHCIVYRRELEQNITAQRLFSLAREYAERWTNFMPEVGDLIPER